MKLPDRPVTWPDDPRWHDLMDEARLSVCHAINDTPEDELIDTLAAWLIFMYILGRNGPHNGPEGVN